MKTHSKSRRISLPWIWQVSMVLTWLKLWIQKEPQCLQAGNYCKSIRMGPTDLTLFCPMLRRKHQLSKEKQRFQRQSPQPGRSLIRVEGDRTHRSNCQAILLWLRLQGWKTLNCLWLQPRLWSAMPNAWLSLSKVRYWIILRSTIWVLERRRWRGVRRMNTTLGMMITRGIIRSLSRTILDTDMRFYSFWGKDPLE